MKTILHGLRLTALWQSAIMARRNPRPQSSLSGYRNFALAVIAIAIAIALFADSAPHDSPPPRADAGTTASPPPVPTTPGESRTTAAPVEDAETEAAAENAPENAMASPEEGGESLPKAGKAAPADKPTPQQIENAIAASRARSGAPPDGD